MYKEENTWADGRSLYLTTDRGSSLKDVTAVYTLFTPYCTFFTYMMRTNVQCGENGMFYSKFVPHGFQIFQTGNY